MKCREYYVFDIPIMVRYLNVSCLEEVAGSEIIFAKTFHNLQL